MSTTATRSRPFAMSLTSLSTSTPRASRFTEGSPLTGEEALSQSSPTSTLLFSILSEMDEHERRRQRSHRDSASSTESFSSISGAPSPFRASNRRSITFGKRSVELVRRSLDDARTGGEEKARGFKGRLRALTGGKEKTGYSKPYHGT